jgi:hypothetical protein
MIGDRRKRPTSVWDVFRIGGRRRGQRRAEEARQPHFVDSHGPATLALGMLLLAFTIIDGLMTFDLLDAGCQEVNPLMGYLLSHSHGLFLLGKFLLTTVGLFVLLIFKNNDIYCGRLRVLRVGHLLPVFALLYTVLIAYQLQLLQQLDSSTCPTRWRPHWRANHAAESRTSSRALPQALQPKSSSRD